MVVVFVEVAGDGDQVNLQFLQVEGATQALFNGGTVDGQAALGINLDHAGAFPGNGTRVAVSALIDHAAPAAMPEMMAAINTDFKARLNKLGLEA